MRTLVLWDIDHTLISPGGISAEIVLPDLTDTPAVVRAILRA